MKPLTKKEKEYLPTGFLDNVETMNDDEMKDTIVKCQQTIVSTAQDMEDDPKLNGAKDLVKDLSEAYRDTINTQKAKVKCVLLIMKQRGKF